MAALVLVAFTLPVALTTMAAVPSAASGAPPGEVGLASHLPTNAVATGNGSSSGTVVSADGRFVAFLSNATNLVAAQEDSNGGGDVFLLERATGAVTLVSHLPFRPTAAGNGSSRLPQLSADGAFLVFTSDASDLVPGGSDTNNASDIYLFERATGSVTLVSHVPGNSATTGNQGSDWTVDQLSDDASWVVFESWATNLVTGQVDANGGSDTFLYERATGLVRLVSHVPGSSVTTANGDLFRFRSVVSGDGSVVAFSSTAPDLVTSQDDTNGALDTFLYERATGDVTLVSRAAGTPATARGGTIEDVSATGAVIALTSSATDLVPGQTDANGDSDAFLFVRAIGAMTLASHVPGSATTAGNQRSFLADLSEDGRRVVFNSYATDLVAGQVDNAGQDVFALDRPSGLVVLVSHVAGSAVTTGNGESGTTAGGLSADGRFAVFSSNASNLVPSQADRTPPSSPSDIFLVDLADNSTVLVSHVPGDGSTTADLGSSFSDDSRSVISADGGAVVFDSAATDLVPAQADTNGAVDAFLFERVRSPGARYHPLDPTRVLDTRDGTGAPLAPLGPEAALDLQIAGRGGIPAMGVSAVVLNVTAVAPSAQSFLTAWPAGMAMPVASNLNYGPGDVVANVVTVKVGAGGRISLYNHAGSVDVVADVAGWFGDAAASTGARFNPVDPTRVLDTRDGTGAPLARLGPGAALDLQVTGRGGIPAMGVSAVVLNVTAVAPTAQSFLTAWPAGMAMPVASNLNYGPGDVVANVVTAKVGAGGRISLYNHAGSVDVVADVAGWFGDAAASTGARFNPVDATRVLDTRDGTGAPLARLGPGAALDLQVTGAGPVPGAEVSAVVLNVTAVAPTAQSFLTAWPAGMAMPVASNLNYGPGDVVANVVTVKVGAGGRISLYNHAGSVDVVADVAGWYSSG